MSLQKKSQTVITKQKREIPTSAGITERLLLYFLVLRQTDTS